MTRTLTKYIDWADVEAAAEAMVNNHARFDSFAWFDQPEDAEQWCIVYTHNRDSSFLDQSNASVIDARLEEWPDECLSQRHNHWACGWVDGYALRVYAADGSITPAFRAYAELAEALEDYPVLDDEDYSRRQTEATLENVSNEARGLVADDAGDDWLSDLMDWLEYDSEASRELDRSDSDDNGKSVSRETLKRALFDLRLLAPEWEWRVYVGGTLTLDTVSQGNAVKEYADAKRYAAIGIGQYADGVRIELDGDDVSERVDELLEG